MVIAEVIGYRLGRGRGAAEQLGSRLAKQLQGVPKVLGPPAPIVPGDRIGRGERRAHRPASAAVDALQARLDHLPGVICLDLPCGGTAKDAFQALGGGIEVLDPSAGGLIAPAKQLVAKRRQVQAFQLVRSPGDDGIERRHHDGGVPRTRKRTGGGAQLVVIAPADPPAIGVHEVLLNQPQEGADLLDALAGLVHGLLVPDARGRAHVGKGIGQQVPRSAADLAFQLTRAPDWLKGLADHAADPKPGGPGSEQSARGLLNPTAMLQSAVPTIRGLEAGFVPHRQWPLRKWYFANPLWFYHEQFPVDEMIPSRAFYELVDPQLRELCLGLHAADLHTTPSCQGHFYGRERFDRIWAELEREQARVTGAGLPVKDSETQEEHLFQDPSFRLPWPSADAFYEEASAQQNEGYIGIVIPDDRQELRDRFAGLVRQDETSRIEFDDAVGRRLGAHLLAIHVSPRSPAERERIWQGITRDILGACEDVRDQRPA